VGTKLTEKPRHQGGMLPLLRNEADVERIFLIIKAQKEY